MATAHMNGARLAFVVRKLSGTVKREKYVMELIKKGQNGKSDQFSMKSKIVDEPAGYLVYFPRGHAIRLRTEAELSHYGLGGKPRIINIENVLADPNSPLNRMIQSQNEEERRDGMLDMERAVIAMATAKTGPAVMQEQMKEAV